MFNPDFEAALKSIFARFDKDKDGYLSKAELQAFAVATNDKEFDEDTLEEIGTYFADESKQPELMMAVEGFLDMYHLQSQNDEDETWKDLTRLGYGPDLKLVEQEAKSKDE
ncbi:hypothetical protein BCR44DRAFT_1432047 [Catenaria anguillulae PL171]|uniref:EF-hand domain-containing protein n=1 Tax=Catenaria anguillulae PL171 TaxID=765915 RepID=A0A1Y2HPI5_9FUNG|nr:hypothetical protein BCR44DRAFT_1432047 [Catenaria anguillulae PL171]